MSSADRCALGWGYSALGFLVLGWVTPDLVSRYSTNLSYAFGIGFFLLMLRRPMARWPHSILLAGILVLQMWSIVCAVYADRILGREMLFSRASVIWVYALIPFFTAWFVVSLAPAAAIGIRRILLCAFVTSSAFAWLQFARLGPALWLAQIYTYKPIDNWDGHPGIRAVGLCGQPNHLAFQATMALALLAVPVLWRRLSTTELAGILFVSGAAIFTQARIGYIGVALLWVILVVLTIRRDRRQALWLASFASICLAIGASTAMKRFGYVTSLSTGPDYSQQARETGAWSQLDTIYPRLWVTGVGPSDGLMLGGGHEDKYVPIGTIVESAYRLVLAMYGVPGLIFFVLTLICSLISYVVGLVRPATDPRRCMLAAAAVAVLLVAINGYSFNTIDNYLMLPCLLLVGGAACNPVPLKISAMRKS